MECPNLDTGNSSDVVCRLLTGPYHPSEFELAEFCTTVRHRRCPLYGTEGATPLRLCRFEIERAVG